MTTSGGHGITGASRRKTGGCDRKSLFPSLFSFFKLRSGAMATMTENPHNQSAVIKDLVARIKELEDKLSIMKDAEVKASTDDHDKLKPIDIKDIERPDKYDNQAAKFNTWFDKFKELLTSRNGGKSYWV